VQQIISRDLIAAWCADAWDTDCTSIVLQQLPQAITHVRLEQALRGNLPLIVTPKRRLMIEIHGQQNAYTRPGIGALSRLR